MKDNKEEKKDRRSSTFDVGAGIQVNVPNGSFMVREAYGLISRGVHLDTEGNEGVNEGTSKKVIPYANIVCMADFAQLETNPDRTSLPTGKYNEIDYVHSDRVLTAKYPQLAAALQPIVKAVLAKYSWTIDYTNETIVLDAIGCVIANSIEGYAEAQAFKRALNVKYVVDEDKVPMAPLFLSNASAPDEGLAMKEWVVPVVGYQLDSDDDGNKMIIEGQIQSNFSFMETDEQQFFTYSQSYFDSKINSKLSKLFLSDKMKALINLVFGSYIKMRYSDADTDRYITFVTKPHAENAGTDYQFHAPDYEGIVADKADKVTILSNRFNFLPEILNVIGAKQLDASVSTEKVGSDRINFDKAGLTFNAIYDDHDIFKNIIDHCAMSNTAYYNAQPGIEMNPLTGDATGNQFRDGYLALMRNYVSVELDSYIGHTLEYGDSAILSDELLNVLANDGVVSLGINYYKFQRNNKDKGALTNAEKLFVSTIGHPVHVSNFRIGSGASAAQYTDLDGFLEQMSEVNRLINDTGIIDPTYDFSYEVGCSSTGGVSFEIDSIGVYYGLNSYVSNDGDMQLIKTYNSSYMFIDSKAVSEINAKIASKNNQTAN